MGDERRTDRARKANHNQGADGVRLRRSHKGTSFRIDTKRQYGTAQSLWAAYPEQLAEVGQRLSGVLIDNRPAIEIIKSKRSMNPIFKVTA